MEFWADEGLATAVSRDARMLYMGLWNLADEAGRCRGGVRYIKGQIFPYDDDLTADRVDALLCELASASKVLRYRVGDDHYLFLPNLARHQPLQPDKTPSKLPEPPDLQEEAIQNNSGIVQEDKEDLGLFYCSSSSISLLGAEEVSGETPDRTAADAVDAKKTKRRRNAANDGTRVPEDFAITAHLRAWAAEKVPGVDLELQTIKFVNHWSNKLGKDALKLDWNRAWQNWVIQAAEYAPANGRASPQQENHSWKPLEVKRRAART